MYNNGDNLNNYGRGRRTNQKQKHILFAAMAMNRKILECRSGESAMRRSRKKVWNNLVAQLNMAGPKKDITQWRKCWTDLRLNMRKKWDKAQNSSYILTEYERRIITSCGMIDYGDKNYESEENSAEDVNSFLNFLDDVKEDFKEEEPHPRYFEQTDEDYSNSQYFANSCERIICEPEEISVKQEYEEESTRLEEFREQEYEEEQTGFEDFEEEKYKKEVPIFEEFKEQEPTTFEEYKEHSVEYISDEEPVPVIIIEDDIKCENNLSSSYEPLETVAVPERKKSPSPKPKLVLPLPNNNISLNPSQELQDATLAAIRKMHRSLLKESKKQTSLLRRLVRGLERENP